MPTMLKFRCVNENCPNNYRTMLLPDSVSEQLTAQGIDLNGSSGKCKMCGSPAVACTVSPGMTQEQSKESSELMDETIERMRKAHALMIQMIGKVKENVGMA